jgi:hypothetical protein
MYGAATHIRTAQRPQDRHEPTRVVELFLAGDISHAKQVIRKWCAEVPCCVTVTPTTFVYRGGEEEGFVVGFRNYPRFPTDSYDLRTLAADLGGRLQGELGQDSWMSVEAGGVTTWSTTRHD